MFLFCELMKIINTRSSTVGARRHDSLQLPISSASDERLKHCYGVQSFLKLGSSLISLVWSTQTFSAIIDVCRVLRLMTIHLLEECHFQFVVTGHIQSDPLESRFGSYRQMSGGNFCISNKQILESEKISDSFPYWSTQEYPCRP